MHFRLVATAVAVTFILSQAASPPADAADAPVHKRWETEYRHLRPDGGDSIDWALTVRQTSDGGYLSGGFAEGSCGIVPSLFKLDARGEVEWHFLFDAGYPCGFGSFGEVLEVEDGFVAFGRKGVPEHGNRMLFVKVDRRGKVLVQRLLNGIRPHSDKTSESGGRAVRRTADGGFVLSGHMSLAPGQNDLLLVKLDASGATEWATTYSGCPNGGEDANAVTPILDPATEDEIGYVVVGGSCGDLIAVRFGLDGAPVWSVKIESNGPPGEVFVAMSGGPGKPFPYSRDFTTTSPCPPTVPTHVDVAQSVEQSRDLEHLIVGGHFNRFEVGNQPGGACPALNAAYGIQTPEYLDGDGILLRLELDGRVDLLRNVAHCSGLDFATRARETVAPEAPGYVFSCTTADGGVVSPGDPTNMLLVKTDPDGEREWHRAFKGPGTGSCAFDMSVTDDGGYVFAGNNLDNRDDYALVRLTNGCQAHAQADVEDVIIPAGTEVVWSSSLRVKGTVQVEPGARLTVQGADTRIEFFDTRQLNDFDSVSRRAGLVVEAGGHLDVRRATLGGLDACNGIWEGVRVLGDPQKAQRPVTQQGRLVARDGATIRDAVEGVHVGGTAYDADGDLSATFTHGGGIVQMTGARLLDNRKGVAFLPYESPSPFPGASNLSFFTDVTFDSDAFMRDTAYVTPDGRRVAVNEHLSLFGVKGVRITGSTFRNSIPTEELDVDIRGTGIGAFDSTFTVRQGCKSFPGFPFFNCLEPDPTLFEGLTSGIVTGSTRFDRRMAVSGSRFVDVQQGITSIGQYFDSIADTTFELPPESAMPVYGVLLDSGSGFSLRRNELTADLPLGNEGVVVRDSGSLPGRINDSRFSGTAVGIRTLGANPYVDIFCNTFEGNPAGALVVGSGHLKTQGAGCGPGEPRADNRFLSPALPHLYSFGADELLYHHADGPVTAVGSVTVACLPDPAAPRCPRTPACNPVCPFLLATKVDALAELHRPDAGSETDAALLRIGRLLERRRTDEALGALSALDGPRGLDLRLEIHLERGDVVEARRILSGHVPRSVEDRAVHELYGLKLRLIEEGRGARDLADDEIALLRELAATPGRVGWIAERWVLDAAPPPHGK